MVHDIVLRDSIAGKGIDLTSGQSCKSLLKRGELLDRDSLGDEDPLYLGACEDAYTVVRKILDSAEIGI
jgi:hypothetical protein